MIILVSASSRAKECAAAIEQQNHQETQVATSLAKAIELLQAHEYDINVVDESFQQVESCAERLVASHAGNAVARLEDHTTAPVRVTGRTPAKAAATA